LLASRRIGRNLAPSTRIEPLPNSGSSVGIAFVASTSLTPSSALFVRLIRAFGVQLLSAAFMSRAG